MSRLHMKMLTVVILTGLVLAACNSEFHNVNGDAPPYSPSTDTHPCLSVAVAAPDVIQLGTEATVRVDVNNQCNEAITYKSSGPPYALVLVRDDEVVWYTPSEPVPDILLDYAVEANGTTAYDVRVPISADDVSPGNYRMIASLFVDQIQPDATQYVKPLRLESEPQSVEVKP
jgi:hypothetical protein